MKRRPYKFAEDDAGQGARSTAEERIKIRDEASTTATQHCATSVEFIRSSHGFTLFEVLIALAVFALAVTGLAIALESIVQTALEARQRTLSRLELESRLAYNMVDPPLEGDRSLSAAENHGFDITESSTPEELQDEEGHPLSGIYRLKISCKMGNNTNSLETLIYRP